MEQVSNVLNKPVCPNLIVIIKKFSSSSLAAEQALAATSLKKLESTPRVSPAPRAVRGMAPRTSKFHFIFHFFFDEKKNQTIIPMAGE